MALQFSLNYSYYFGVSSPHESLRQLVEGTSQLTPACVAWLSECKIALWNLLLKRSRIYKTQKTKPIKLIIDILRVSHFGDTSIMQRVD